jgi:uncharacterized membrane protein
MHFLLQIPSAIAFLIIAVVVVTVTLAGLFLVRRRYSPEQLKENHEVAAIIFSAFGWLYAVVVAFVVFVTWQGYDEASKNLQLEASQALDIFHSTDAFNEPMGNEIRRGLVDYLETVGNDELLKMSGENMALYSMPPLRRLQHRINTALPTDVRNTELYSASLRRLDNLAEYRRLRIFSGRNNVPPFIWLVLLVGGGIMVANTYFFAMKHIAAQAMMIAGLTITLSFILFLIFILDHPFTGVNRVSDEPLQQALAMMKDRLPAESTNR